jgi:hypothetical protein
MGADGRAKRSRVAAGIRRGRARLVVLAVAFAGFSAFLGAGAESAFAGPGYYINVYNRMSHGDVALVAARGEDCWYTNDLGRSADQNAVSPGRNLRLYTEKKNAAFTSCLEGNATRGIDLKVRDAPGGSWYVPTGSPGDFRIYFYARTSASDFGFQLLDTLGTWAPRHDGTGLICWHTVTYTDKKSNFSSTGYADIYVYNDAHAGHCNIAVPTKVTNSGNWGSQQAAETRANTPVTRPSLTAADAGAQSAEGTTAKPPHVIAQEAAGTTGQVVDLLSTIGIACPWYAYPKDTSRCTGYDVGNADKWSIDNVTHNIRNLSVTGGVGTSDPKTTVGTAQISIPATSPAGTLSVNQSVATTQTSTTAVQHGAKVGFKLAFKQTAGVVFAKSEFSQEITGEYNYSNTQTESTANTVTRQVSISAGAAPGYTTTLDVFTVKRDINYTYKADLDLGKDSTVQAIDSPANLALEQSPARRQPCLEYAIGGKDTRNSIMYTGDQLLKAGFSPTEPTLPAERRAFLQSIPFFTTPGGPCPGFPSGYASFATFKGDGVGTYANLGYDDKGNPVKVMTGCVYQTPFPPLARTRRYRLESPDARPAVASSPCQDVPVSGGAIHAQAGNLLDERTVTASGGKEPVVVAPPGSDEILGPDVGGTVYTNNGAVDIVRTGKGDTKVIGGSGENVLYGGPGRDTLVGGHGGMNYLHAGSGPNTLTESDGSAEMFGGPSADTFNGHNMNGVMAGDSGSSTMIGTGDLSRLQMLGGRGPNTYVVNGRGTPAIFQLPSRAPSTLMTNHTMVVPAFVKTAKATGSANVRLTGNSGTQKLIANSGRDTLVAGPAAVRMQGGGRGDTFVFNPYNDAVATGGRGANRFEFTGTPERATRPASLAKPAGRTAAVITNFNGRRGDRLVLRASVFGRAVTRLAHRFRLVAGRSPRPSAGGPTLLFDTRAGVLSFDPDGTGPISDQVIVKLPGLRTVNKRWLTILPR